MHPSCVLGGLRELTRQFAHLLLKIQIPLCELLVDFSQREETLYLSLYAQDLARYIIG